ncbi:hypothetical protein D9615_000285 [Tricholomella constricta]|uniref:DNA breaking-rejoining enzyme n=1 Tax=Tricholomella constricta TaxID=117010 RepID=A0A8H5MC64_9AGAR|nr:hypothetical protein D9615_000285 [Tricholomella constricta]
MSTPPHTTSNSVAPGVYVMPSSPRERAARTLPQHNAKTPSEDNSYTQSPYRPPVPADQRLLLWTTPHSRVAQTSIDSQIPPDYQPLLYSRFLESLSRSTRQSYGAGLLRFTQFCDHRLRIPEEQRMPASDLLLSIFVADASGSHSGNCIRNWLNGLRAWHILNRADWHGHNPWVLTYRKAADKLGVPFKRPPRSPITAKHLLALHQKLNLNTPRDAAVWAAALAAFWGCRRLGELLPSSTSFSPALHVSRSSNITSSVVTGSKVLTFHLPSTKTSPSGDQCILTATNNIFCPVSALLHHLRLNNVSSQTHLFSYSSPNSSSHSVLTKSLFLDITSRIFSAESLDPVFGHSIGGTVELLAMGVPPEVVMKLGGWTSLCFLNYWRRLDFLVPAAITRAWVAQRDAFAHTYNL